MQIRGVMPTVEELGSAPELEVLVDAWLSDEAFLRTVEDLAAELLLLRTDTRHQLPVLGPLAVAGLDQAEVYRATVEAPLRFASTLVAEDRPWTEVLTADWTLTNSTLAAIYGLDHDPDGPEWQRTTWTDGRPMAGWLSDSEVWRRHVSNGSNFHRGRAAFVADTFLCDDIAGRELSVAGTVDITDEAQVAQAVRDQPACAGCHQTLDPLAAFFWGYKEQIMRNAVLDAYAMDCTWDWSLGEPDRGAYRPEHFCYPLQLFDVSEEQGWQDWDLRGPGFYGQPLGDLRDLGAAIVDDPRFATCTARTFYAYLTQVERDQVSDSLALELADVLTSSDWSIRALTRAIVLHPTQSRRDATGPMITRPEQYARTLHDLTGFRWETDLDPIGCQGSPNSCWGTVDLLSSDLFGFRALMGGVDGSAVLDPTHWPTPTRTLAVQALAAEAAGWIVAEDFARPSEDRRLFGGIDTDANDDEIRAHMVWLHGRVLGEPDADVEATWELFVDVRDRSDTDTAWRVVLTAMFEDLDGW